MTKPEFVSRQRAMDTYTTKCGFVLVGGYVAIALCLLPLRWHYTYQPWIRPFFLIISIVYFFAGTIVVAWLSKRRQRQLGAICPQCGKPFGKSTSRVVIATGNCGHCGTKI